ncbi:MAG: hypothetical protein IIA66_04560 [Planctomycetes bacterium]|nr:hypothetical protein [Planctomycetota bacterium]
MGRENKLATHGFLRSIAIEMANEGLEQLRMNRRTNLVDEIRSVDVAMRQVIYVWGY